MTLTRRRLLGAALAGLPLATSSETVRIRIDTTNKLGRIPNDFLGLGYEISSVAIPGLLTAANRAYVNLVRALSPSGVIRVGGITADFASFSPQGRTVSTPRGTVVNLESLHDLASFLKATGWTLIWALNLGQGSIEQVVQEAAAVSAAVNAGSPVLFELGNEPDLFNRGSFSHRPNSYGYDDWLSEYRRFKTAVRAKLPNAVFAGPDAATMTDWVTRLAQDEGHDLKLLTHHYYRECAGPTSTLDKLLHPDPKLASLLEKLAFASQAAGVPYRICETNSFCGGGKPGVSDTFGAALWTLDFFWRLAEGGCAGVNLETGVNQLDFVSSYSPIVDNRPRPDYYGMLAFAPVLGAERLQLDLDARDLNLTAYAAAREDGNIILTMVNKDVERGAEARIETNANYRAKKVMRLTGPGLDAKEGVTFAPSSEKPVNQGKPIVLRIPAASASVVTLAASR